MFARKFCPSEILNACFFHVLTFLELGLVRQWRVLHWVAGLFSCGCLACARGPGLFCARFLSGLDELKELFGETKTILRDDKGLHHRLAGSIPPLLVI